MNAASPPPPLPVTPPRRRKRTWRQKISLAFGFLGSFLTTLLFVRAILGSITPNVVIPPINVPTRNAFDGFVQAGKMVGKDKDAIADAVYSKSKKPLSHTEKEALLVRNAPALALLRRSLLLPYRDASGPRSFNTEFPQYAQFRTLARLLVLEGDVKRENGDKRGAAQSYADAVVFGHTLLQGAPLLGHLVGRACEAVGRKPLWKMVDTLDAQTARQIAHRLQATFDDNPGSFAVALAEEKLWGQSNLMEIFNLNLRDAPAITMGYVVWGKRDIMHNYTSFMDQMIVGAHQPYQIQPKLPPVPSDFFSQVLLPMFLSSRYKSDSSDTQNALLITALGLQVFRNEHNGAYPYTLSGLVPQTLARVPVDPLAYPAAPPCYKGTGTGYLLWSVGPDGKNDGGAPITDYKPTSGPATGISRYMTTPMSKGDIVAGTNTN